MRASYYQEKKYGNRPSATRGVTERVVNLMRHNPKAFNMTDELKVEIRVFTAKDGTREYQVTTNEEILGSYKDLAPANQKVYEYVQLKKRDGWTQLNERQTFKAQY